MDKLLKMRPHHGLCLQFFIGKGYGGGFEKNMVGVSLTLKNNPETQIMLVGKPDAICGCCPHNLCGTCESAEKVARYDKECLAFCGLDFEQILTWNNFRHLIMSDIISVPERRRKVCADCEWDPICQQLYVEKLSKLLKVP